MVVVKRIDRTTCWRTAKQTLKTRSEGRSEREGQRGDGREQGGRDGVWWWTGRGGVVVVMMEAALSEPSGFQGEQKQSRSSLAATELGSFLLARRRTNPLHFTYVPVETTLPVYRLLPCLHLFQGHLTTTYLVPPVPPRSSNRPLPSPAFPVLSSSSSSSPSSVSLPLEQQ